MQVCVAQFRGSTSVASNLATCTRLMRQAANKASKMIFFSEASDFIGNTPQEALTLAASLEGEDGGVFLNGIRREAGHLGLWSTTPGKLYNTHVVIDSEGSIVEKYRKIHLFDVNIANGPRLMESDTTVPGDQVVHPIRTPIGQVGLAICYDLRFPELAANLRSKGAEILTYPSAFTPLTGQAHWEVLLRSRAIETQSYVIAAAQVGKHTEKRSSYGHAMIVDPWGRVIAECSGQKDEKIERDCGEDNNDDEAEIATAIIDHSLLAKTRLEMPARLNLSCPQSENSSPPLQRVPSSSLPCSPSFVSDIDDNDNGVSGSPFDSLPTSPAPLPLKRPLTPQQDQHEDLLSFFPAAPLSSFSALNTISSSPSSTASTALFSSSSSSSSSSPTPTAKLLHEHSLQSSLLASTAPFPRLARQTSFLTFDLPASIHPPEFTSAFSASHAPESLDHRVQFPYLARRPSTSSHAKTAAPSDLFSTAIDRILASTPPLHSNNNDSDHNEDRSARHQVASLYQHNDNRSLVSSDRLTADSRAHSRISSTNTISRLSSSFSSMSSESESSASLSAASGIHDHPMVSDATSATTSTSDPNLRGATNDSVDVSATEIEIKQESLEVRNQQHQPPQPAPQGVNDELDQLTDEYRNTHTATTNGHQTSSLVSDPPRSIEDIEATVAAAAAAVAAAAAFSMKDHPLPGGDIHVDADGDITMNDGTPADIAALDSTIKVEQAISSTAAELAAAAMVAAVVGTTLPTVLPVPPITAPTTTTTTATTTTIIPDTTFVTMPLIPTVGVPNAVGEQDQLLSPSPSPQRPGSPSQQQQERHSSHSPPTSSTNLKPTAGDTKPRSKSFDATAASAALATTTTTTLAAASSSSSSSAAAAGDLSSSTSSTSTTGKAPRVRKGAPPTEKRPLKVYPPRKQRSRVNWDEAKVPPESPLSTLASAAVAVSTLSAATAITPASTMPITPTVSAVNGGGAGTGAAAAAAAAVAAAAAAAGVGMGGGSGTSSGAIGSGSVGNVDGSIAGSGLGSVGSSTGNNGSSTSNNSNNNVNSNSNNNNNNSSSSSSNGSGLATVGGGPVSATTHHAVPDDATLQALSKARAQLAAEGGGYRCELCPGERFGRVHDLKRHHISKHNEMTWPCDFCHRPFVRRDALLRHYTVKAARNDGVHPTQEEPERLSEARARAKLLS
ncbi:Carbon-nitrogen hydrolase [Actinomortierella ambigua]|uniref:Carbon-nitrogen hydrolase n=1 Tax=Actinomortierella ambigua TaxID=1343610 RepID=A0A9P6UD65_9FUNG|nr:Carbon-nitrogen hydrolase [Actinomortierella ambigua]